MEQSPLNWFSVKLTKDRKRVLSIKFFDKSALYDHEEHHKVYRTDETGTGGHWSARARDELHAFQLVSEVLRGERRLCA